MDAVAADAAADVDGTRAPTSRSIRGVELSIDRSAAALDRERGKRRSRRARRAMGSPGEDKALQPSAFGRYRLCL
jgi:hypothetical protein